VFLKICGITRLVDARHAVEQGATALGFVLWPKSPRFVSNRKVAEIVAALPPSITTVGVFVNESPEGIALTMERTGLTVVQLHGDEPAPYARALRWPIWRAVTLDTADDVFAEWSAETTFLVDAADPDKRGGTGQVVEWTKAAPLARRRRIVLAGGLTPDNVQAAIREVQPYGVDVSSGVEDAPGLKDPKKVALFLERARRVMAELYATEMRKRLDISKRRKRIVN
jgi:phosphoribosylanthranilate isomerase